MTTFKPFDREHFFLNRSNLDSVNIENLKPDSTSPVEAVFSNLVEDAVGFIDSQILKKFAEYGYSQQWILSNLHRVCAATVGATTIYSIDGRELFGVRHVLDLSEGFGVVTLTDTLIFDLNPAK